MSRRDVLDRLPHLDELTLHGRSAEIFREEREELVDTSCRWGLDCLDTSIVCCFADLLCERVGGANEVGRIETCRREDRDLREIENPLEVRPYGPQLTREEVLDLDALPFCQARELGHTQGFVRHR